MPVVQTPGPVFRDFDAEMEEVTGEAITFKLSGTVFRCVHPLPIGNMLVMARRITSADIQQQAGAISGALWGWVVPEQHAEFDEAVAKVTSMKQLERLMEFISEQATGRPSQGS